MYPLDREEVRDRAPSDFEVGILDVLLTDGDLDVKLRVVGVLDDGASSSIEPRLSVEAVRKFDVDSERERVIFDTRRVKGEGASSSSLSLQPSPVVKPRPPRKSLPSR